MKQTPSRVRDATSKKLSLVVPVYNEAESLPAFFTVISSTLKMLQEKHRISYEIIFVDDGSSDTSLNQLIDARRDDDNIIILELSRNFGKEAAMVAGLNSVTGDIAVIIDADLQDPPHLIDDFIEAWQEGNDVVYGMRSDRSSDPFLKSLTAALFYSSFNKVSGVKIPAHAGDFRLLDRTVIDDICRLTESNLFMKGLFAWVGYRQKAIAFSRPERLSGRSKYSYWRLWNFAIDGILSFSTAPLRIWTYIGGTVAVCAFIAALLLVFYTLFVGRDVPGYASIMVTLLFMSGVQLVVLGIIGEYLGRIYQETKSRPRYLIKRRHDSTAKTDS